MNEEPSSVIVIPNDEDRKAALVSARKMIPHIYEEMFQDKKDQPLILGSSFSNTIHRKNIFGYKF